MRLRHGLRVSFEKVITWGAKSSSREEGSLGRRTSEKPRQREADRRSD